MNKVERIKEKQKLETLLGSEETANLAGAHPRRKLAFMGATAAVVLILIYFLWPGGEGATANRYRTAEASRGDITITVTATGTVEPTNVVDVSSELSGTVRTVYVDYNDKVKKNQPLAKLDVDKLEAQVAHSRASLAASQAKVSQVEATVVEVRKKLERMRTLARKKISSEQDLEAAEATYNRALADMKAAQADVKVTEADMSTNETNLSKAFIRSPIDGVVLSRDVDPGQTVASSLQAPTLFTIAEDLRKMELQVDIDEADIGAVKEGQRATFTVEAYQNRKFPAVIKELRYQSETTSGVVTYKGILSIDNADLLLRPGMTATAEIVVEHAKDGLLVPNAALRWSPPSNGRSSRNRSILQSILPRPPRTRRVAKNEPTKEGMRHIYVLKNGEPAAVEIKPGASDGKNTLVLEGPLKAGDEVIVDSTQQKS